MRFSRDVLAHLGVVNQLVSRALENWAVPDWLVNTTHASSLSYVIWWLRVLWVWYCSLKKPSCEVACSLIALYCDVVKGLKVKLDTLIEFEIIAPERCSLIFTSQIISFIACIIWISRVAHESTGGTENYVQVSETNHLLHHAATSHRLQKSAPFQPSEHKSIPLISFVSG